MGRAGTFGSRRRLDRGIHRVEFLSRAHQREKRGHESPGPAYYNPINIPPTPKKRELFLQ